LQIGVGDKVGLVIHRYQPLKTAAMEGLWDTQRGAPFVLFAIPDQHRQKNSYSLAIPYAASLINTHSLNGEMVGLKTVSPHNQPYVPLVFFSFRIMIGIGLLMTLVALTGLWLFFTKRLYTSRWFLRLCIFMSPTGFIALLAGWITSETGRQPWIVYNLIRTHDALAHITLSQVLISFISLILVYLIIFCVFYVRYLGRILQHGPTTEVLPADSVFRYLSTTEIK
ncbi:MAG: cydA, partial [Gammaproteobacteria bacterium]|nr:cydA [Gammaproteobacteria bacterium]